ncbi:nucleoside hydrolase [Proteiniclasticum ruminis]|uniref:Purine nucleosidase/pyrimidine-specific ribonucleoside hydrolase n=1 Tax=Proteiniclasticum ruminis TaxID=398199 RepID=A0A1G8KDG9_9CLOT|nr:nucleoside hydrolase [Proteiniclasticum ruminis]SDI41496.1 purine nucleosidase/pyrimidine-specific ribonucleoside hydrolase [Proteiniclasticum ruminis]
MRTENLEYTSTRKKGERIPLLIDCDPGIDDAMALMVARASEGFELKGITSVSGNLDIETTTKNIELFAKVLKLNAVLASGASEPLVKGKFSAEEVHGSDGLGGASSLFGVSLSGDRVQQNAVDTMRKLLLEEERKTAIVAIGPLTNIALLLKIYPEVKEKIRVISIMGGSLEGGNVTPLSEFNFYVDPEAASIVFQSGVPLILSGLHMTVDATITEENLEEIRNHSGVLGVPAAEMLKTYPGTAHPLHDPCAVLALSHPEIFTYEDLTVHIDTREGDSQGMSYKDERPWVKKETNCRVLLKIHQEKFRRLLVDTLAF